MKPATETWTAAQYRAYIAKGGGKPHVPAKNRAKSKKGVTQMALLLTIEGIPFKTEVLFHPVRKWRFDFAIDLPGKMIALEFEGIMSKKSRHTTATGYTGDCSKYNEAQKLGWTVLRYTTMNYSKLIEDLKELLKINPKQNETENRHTRGLQDSRI